MNPRLKLALIRHTGEQGFASVIAVGVGLVLMIIGLTMALRSQSDVALSSTQKSTSRALSAAEVGVTRYQQLINNGRILAKYNACSTSTNYNSSGSCLDTTTTTPVTWPIIDKASDYNSCSFQNVDISAITDASKNIWRNIDPATTNPDLTLGQYRLVSYQYQSSNNTNPTAENPVLGNGTLTVEGRVRVSGSGNTATQTTSTSTARLQVVIPVKYTDSNIPVPSALWTGNTSIAGNNNQKVDGDVLVNKCTTNSTQMETYS
jgi:Tfp pilus assembly protein PilX